MEAVDPPAHLSTFSTVALGRALDMADFVVRETVYTTNICPWSMSRMEWLLDTAVSPLMRWMGSGLHVKMLATKRGM